MVVFVVVLVLVVVVEVVVVVDVGVVAGNRAPRSLCFLSLSFRLKFVSNNTNFSSRLANLCVGENLG